MLSGLNILVTRPKPQGEELCEFIRMHAGNPIFLPMIEIIPQPVPEHLPDNFDWFIFTSMHAVYNGAKIIQPSAKVAAIGMGTMKALQEMKVKVHAFPKSDWRSEGLLVLPVFHRVKGKKIAIVQGDGGRTFLAETLSARGAVLTKVVVYQRVIPRLGSTRHYVSTKYLDEAIQTSSVGLFCPSPQQERNDECSQVAERLIKNIDMITATSGEILQNLKTVFQDVWQQVCQIPIIVISDRLVILANELGCKKIFLAKNASHDAIIAALTKEKENL